MKEESGVTLYYYDYFQIEILCDANGYCTLSLSCFPHTYLCACLSSGWIFVFILLYLIFIENIPVS